jgi:hypothetical protein
MVESGYRVRLVRETLCRLVVAHMGREELEGNESVELEILGLIDYSHAALAELLEDLVM